MCKLVAVFGREERKKDVRDDEVVVVEEGDVGGGELVGHDIEKRMGTGVGNQLFGG